MPTPKPCPPAKAINILLVDDHVLVRDGITQLINQRTDMRVIAAAADADTALKAFARSKPDLAVIDVTLRNGDGIDLVKRIRARDSQFPMIMLSMHDETIYGPAAIRAGAMGYVMKDQSITTLIAAIQRVAHGNFYLNPKLIATLAHPKGAALPAGQPFSHLTDRERQVFRLIAQWRTPKQIAADLKLSRKTIDYYRARLTAKFGLRTVSQLTRYAVENPPDQEKQRPLITTELTAGFLPPSAHRPNSR